MLKASVMKRITYSCRNHSRESPDLFCRDRKEVKLKDQRLSSETFLVFSSGCVSMHTQNESEEEQRNMLLESTKEKHVKQLVTA